MHCPEQITKVLAPGVMHCPEQITKVLAPGVMHCPEQIIKVLVPGVMHCSEQIIKACHTSGGKIGAWGVGAKAKICRLKWQQLQILQLDSV